MHDLPFSDRRLESNHQLSAIVDTALVCSASLGVDAAKRILLNHNIPSTTSARVLFHPGKRRLTELERANRVEASRPLQ